MKLINASILALSLVAGSALFVGSAQAGGHGHVSWGSSSTSIVVGAGGVWGGSVAGLEGDSHAAASPHGGAKAGSVGIAGTQSYGYHSSSFAAVAGGTSACAGAGCH